ncbi:alpha/beta fold hydrolase [Allokutzneria sp. A3M-2-11 16]|uniref:alpha/beta fold hydrolase n=1 Tax=Allokutzneria sp. A3M-2-11 16 TaxID=2962043 RepID=UPI0020B8C9D7|nr:alpha/beta hydrolase [Allokutzneria sp. A3M-2-11 16]MCP3803522.1 alpha/beta fold hydrolase [Allokutzneria sp. A3M-2-11 16]
MPELLVEAEADVLLWSQDLGDPAAPPLLLITPDVSSSEHWPDDLLAGFAAAGFRVLRYDQRDTGRSTRRDFEQHPYTIDTLVKDAIRILDDWGINRAHVFGFGMGGAIGQLLAIEHADRLLSVTLAGSFALGVDFFGNWERALNGEPSADGLPPPRMEFLDAVAGGDHEDHPHAHLPDTLLERGPDLARITTRTLVVQGALDPICPPPHGRHLADRISGADFVEIADLGLEFTESNRGPLVRAVAGHCLR